MRRFYCCAVALALVLAVTQPARADFINFEAFTEGDTIGASIPGMTFVNAIVLTSGAVGGSLNEFEFPPRSGVNVVSDNGGPLSILFANSIAAFSGHFTYLSPLTLTAYDMFNNQVALSSSLFANNLALSGQLGSSPNEFISIAFGGGISRIDILGDPLGGSFTLDDAMITPVPEPSSMILLGTAVCAILLRKRFLKKNNLSKP
jgi:PEP-CTERM motif